MGSTIAAWVDGVLLAKSMARTSVFSHVVSYGSGVFEGIRAYEELDSQGQPIKHRNVWLLPEHIRRLRSSAKAYGMEIRFSDQELIQAVLDVVARNEGHTYIRPVVFRGEGLGVDPSNVETVTAIGTTTWGAYVSKHLFNEGASVLISDLIRPPARMFPGASKGAPGYGAWSQLAKIQANEAETSEALLQGEDDQGRRFVVDGSGMNLCTVVDGIVYTPNPQRWNILSGLTLNFLLNDLIGEHRFQWAYKDLTRQDLLAADEVFLTGTATEVTAVTQIKFRDEERRLHTREVNRGHIGPVAIRLRRILESAAHGQREEYRRFLTGVPQLQSASL